jgi:predicted TIM-barrel fold metal-dependent hydrolase
MTPIVDANLHVIAPPAERGRFPLAAGASAGAADDEATGIDELARVMDDAGVAQGLLFGSRHHGFDNSYCAAAAARYPGRFAAVANVDATSPGARADLDYWAGQRGLPGVRLWGGPAFHTDRRAAAAWLGDRALDPLWADIRDRGLPCNAHKTFPELLPATRELLTRVPGLRLTLNNLAQVPAAEGTGTEAFRNLLTLASFRDVYVSFPAHFAARAGVRGSAERRVLVALVDAFGAGRLCWSAFYPSLRHRSLAASVALVREALSFLPGPDTEQILGGAARSLYPVLADPPAGLPATTPAPAPAARAAR